MKAGDQNHTSAAGLLNFGADPMELMHHRLERDGAEPFNRPTYVNQNEDREGRHFVQRLLVALVVKKMLRPDSCFQLPAPNFANLAISHGVSEGL